MVVREAATGNWEGLGVVVGAMALVGGATVEEAHWAEECKDSRV